MQGLGGKTVERKWVEENAIDPNREFANLLLANWRSDPDLAGGYLINLVDTDTLETEIREIGTVPEFSTNEIRSCLLSAAETIDCGWAVEPAGLGYPLRWGETLLGICVLFPSEEIPPQSHWEHAIRTYCEQVGGDDEEDEDSNEPSLLGLAAAIPRRTEDAETSESNKLHWERSKARVEVPVNEELAKHLLLDHLPLF